MSAISQKSISGITSITTPAGIDDQLTLHTSDTSQAAKLDGAGNFHFSNHVNTTGITSASNFKTGSSNLHSTGLTVGDTFVHSTGVNASSMDVDDFVDVGNNIKLGNAGVITATSFVGDGSDLTNLPAGLGTALSATATSPLNKMYYTNQVLGVPSSVTVDVPASASKAYTQYADIKVESSADLIIAEGDDLIPDVLGLADFGTFGGGASAGRIRVNSITNAANDGSPTVQKGLVVTGVCTATSFSGDGSALTGLSGVSVANQADNRLITATGTTDALNAEANLTYNTLELAVNGDITLDNGGSAGLNFKRGGVLKADIEIGSSSGELAIRARDSSGFIKLATGSSGDERLRINSSGSVSIGNNPTVHSDTIFHVEKSSGETNVKFEGNDTMGARLQLHNNSTSGSAKNQIDFCDAGGQSTSSIQGFNTDQTNNLGELVFATRSAQGTPPAERLRIESGGNVVLKRGGISATPSVKIFGSGNASDTAADDFTIHNWGDSDGDYWRLGVNCGMDANGNDSKPSNTLKGAGITIDGRYGRVFLKTSPSSSSTVYDTLIADSAGRVSKPNTPFVMVTINTTTNRQQTGNQYIIPWDTIHGRGTQSNVGSCFNTSNHRFTAPIAGRYMFICSMNIRGDNICYHRINGNQVSYAEYRMTELVWDHVDFSFVYDMNANDYYEMYSQLYNGSGHRWNGGNTANGGWDTLSIYHLG